MFPNSAPSTMAVLTYDESEFNNLSSCYCQHPVPHTWKCTSFGKDTSINVTSPWISLGLAWQYANLKKHIIPVKKVKIKQKLQLLV